MTDIVKVKLGVLITLALQTIALAYFFGSFKSHVDSELKHQRQILESIREEQLKRTFHVYKVDELIRRVDKLENHH